MIEISHVTIKYGDVLALNDFSYCFEDGVSYSLIGASGCGKSTLLYVLAGLINSKHAPKKDVSLLLQDYGLLPWKTVWENSAFLLKDRNITEAEISERLETLLKELDITELRDRYPQSLSGGQKQRAALVRALCTRPQLLLLDEPGAALDAFTRESMQMVILALIKKYPITLISVTHDLEEACILGKKIIVMKKAGVFQIIENPFFGLHALRENHDFFLFCTEVRRCVALAISHGG